MRVNDEAGSRRKTGRKVEKAGDICFPWQTPGSRLMVGFLLVGPAEHTKGRISRAVEVNKGLNEKCVVGFVGT